VYIYIYYIKFVISYKFYKSFKFCIFIWLVEFMRLHKFYLYAFYFEL